MHVPFKGLGPYAPATSWEGVLGCLEQLGVALKKVLQQVGRAYDIVPEHTMSIIATISYVRHTTSYLSHTISYVKKGTYDDMNLGCRMYNTYDIVCISGPTILYTIYTSCGIRCCIYILRCRRLTFDAVKIYDVVPTMS
jgi:hypothetical protein